MLFRCNKDERSLSFKQIAETTKVELDEVEYLVMKAMSLELVRGTIDQVEQMVHVDWILPRYLTLNHLQIMVGKLKDWETRLEDITRYTDGNAEELINS